MPAHNHEVRTHGWQERYAYFEEHGPNPAEPFIELRLNCGCSTIWRIPERGEARMCNHHAEMLKRQLHENRFGY